MSNTQLLQKIQSSFIGKDTDYPTLDGNRGPRRYLDSAASTLMMGPAFEVTREFLSHYASTHSKLHYAAKGASEAYDWAHQSVLKFVGADDSYNCYFTGSGATAGFNRISTELANQRPDRNIVLVSEMEHHSNDLPHRAHSKVVHIPAMGEGAAYGGIDAEVVKREADSLCSAQKNALWITSQRSHVLQKAQTRARGGWICNQFF